MGTTRFYLTGRLTIEGRALVDQASLPGRHGRLALVRLVLARHRPVPTSELADAIWGARVPASVDGSLRAIVSKVRAVIVEAAPGQAASLTFDSGCYQLRAPEAWVDVEEAGNAVDRAEGRLRSGHADQAWGHATVATAIARRPLLPGEEAPWVEEARTDLHDALVRALSVLAEVWRRRGDHGLAVATARELVALDPFREAGHRALMAAHAAEGDLAAAVRAHEACRRLLADELGIDPSPQTHELYVALLRGARPAPRVPE